MLLSFLKAQVAPAVSPNAEAKALIALATLVYQCDGKFCSEEQEAFEAFLLTIHWDDADVSLETFRSQIVAQARQALADPQGVGDFVANWVSQIEDPDELSRVLKQISGADGTVSLEEQAVLGQILDALG